MDRVLYSEAQPVPRKIIRLILVLLCCIFLALTVMMALNAYYILSAIAGFAALIPAFLFFWPRHLKLYITVWDDRITMAYRGRIAPQGTYISDLHFRATITGDDDIEFPFEMITGVTVQTYDAKNDFNGWGERYGSKKRGTDNMRTFTVSGNKAVTIQLRSGEKILVGTQEPEKLINALTSAARGIL